MALLLPGTKMKAYSQANREIHDRALQWGEGGIAERNTRHESSISQRIQGCLDIPERILFDSVLRLLVATQIHFSLESSLAQSAGERLESCVFPHVGD